MDSSPEKQNRPSQAAMSLYMSAGMAARLEVAYLGPDEIGKRSLSSPFVVKTFLKNYPSIGTEFLTRAGTDEAALTQVLNAEHEDEAAPPPPILRENPTEEQRKIHEIVKKVDDDRRASGGAAPYTLPLKQAMRAAKTRAKEEGLETFGVAWLMTSVFETESIARDALMQVADPEAISVALTWLRVQPDPTDAPDFMASQKSNMKEMLERMWPKLRSGSNPEAAERFLASKNQLYEKNPERYEQPLDLATEFSTRTGPEVDNYTWRTGVCLHAASNEARIRRAPETTLDHMFVVLLRDGTDTAAFLDRYGVDRSEWTARMDAVLPRFDEGPRFPPNNRGLGMSMPSNSSVKFGPLPEGVDRKSLSPEEMGKYMVRSVETERRFTDLAYARTIPDEPKTVACGLLAEAGITSDAIEAEIRANETGDPDWWRKPPDLVADLKVAADNSMLGPFSLGGICGKSAQFEARMRGADKASFDDLLVALLVPGTDLWGLVEALHLDPASLRAQVDATRQRQEIGTMFPVVNEIRSGMALISAETFSDLLYLHQAFRMREKTPISPGLAILESHGVDQPAVARRMDELDIQFKFKG